MTIWKYPLLATGRQIVRMPEGAQILTVQTQNDAPCLWALVDEGSGSEERIIYTQGTGEPFIDDPEDLTYIGTYQLQREAFGVVLIFHVFTPK